MNERKENVLNVSGIIYVLVDDDRVLLTKRIKEGSNFFNEYLFPGGRMEKYDSTTVGCAKREIKEERGCNVKELISLGVVSYKHPSAGVISLEVFMVGTDNIIGEVDNKEPEKEELVWVTIEEANKLCKFEGARMVLDLVGRLFGKDR